MRLKNLLIWAMMTAFGLALLAGCGRKGDLEVPGVYDANGKPVHTTRQPPVKDRHFILDPLIQ